MMLSTSIRSWFRDRIEWTKTNPLLTFLCSLLIVLFSTFTAVMFSSTAEESIGRLLGLGLSEENEKNKILTFLGIGMGGILLALQAVIANRRAKALEDTAKAQADAAQAQAKATEEQAKANQNAERGQRQERLKNAIEHLGHNSDSVRLGGAYELFHLAKDTENLRQTVMDILCAHIRRTTGEKKYRQDYPSKPSEEVQSLLTLLFVQDHEVFKGCHIHLQGSWLNGANLEWARLEKAILAQAYMHKAVLDGAHLQGVDLSEAHLHEASLNGAHLDKADLVSVRLDGASLVGAKLSEATLDGARLHGADLSWAQLYRATLFEAQLNGASLVYSQLHMANLDRAHLHGARLDGAQFHEARLLDAQLHGASLAGVELYRTRLVGSRLHGVDLTQARIYGSNLCRVELQGAILNQVHFQETIFGSANLQGVKSDWRSIDQPFADRMGDGANKNSDLSGAIFTGGLTQKDVNSIIQGLPDPQADELRAKLESHIDKPASNQLPEDSGAITGAYTKEQAEQWIAEYEEAMSAAPKADNGQ